MVASKIAGARTLRFGLALATLFVVSVLADRVLGRLGFPACRATEAVGPPHWSTTIDNVEFSYVLRTNDVGIRDRVLPLRKPQGTFRIVALGDSMTEGMGVTDAERWSSRLEELLRDDGRAVEIVNCAESGTGPLDYARVLASIGWRYEPDLVLVGLYQNDVADTPVDADARRALADPRRGVLGLARTLWPHVIGILEGRRRPRGSGALDVVGEARAEAARRGVSLEAVQRWRAALPPELVSAADAGRLSPSVLTYPLTRPRYFHETLDLDTGEARERAAAVERLLGAMREACHARNVAFGVVLIPCVFQYDPDAQVRLKARLQAAVGAPLRPEWAREPTELARALERWALREDVPFLDLTPSFRAALARGVPAPLNFAIDGHWTAEGHALAAAELLAWLEDGGLVPRARAR